MTDLWRQLVKALRSLARQPGSSTVAALTLAIGIGAATTVLTVVDSVLVRPLPYPAPERIVMVWETPPDTLRNPVSGPNYLDWKRQSRSFGALAAVAVQPFNLSGTAEPDQVFGAKVTAGFFEVFGAPPALGRAPRPDESAARVAVISDHLWKQRFAASPAILGSELRVDGETHTVIGVLPPGFEPRTRWSLGKRMDVWVPFEPPSAPQHRGWHAMEVVGRLADGVTLEQAQTEMTSIARDLEARYPDSNRDYGARVASLHGELAARGRPPLLLLLAAALLVLVIGCANVAGILLARTSARGTELALRASLGAGSRRIAVQMLTECIPLVVISGALGLAAAWWGLGALGKLLPSRAWQVQHLAINGRVALLCLVLSIVAGALVATPLAALAPPRDLARWLRSDRGETGTTTQHRRLRRALIVSQLALGLVLANAAVLLLASFNRLLATDQGFDQANLLTARLQLVGPKYSEKGQVGVLLGELQRRLESLPGVREAAVTTKLPLYGGNNGNEIIEGRERDFGTIPGPEVERSTVSPTYFRTMGIPLVDGRLLTDSDAEAPVAVINQAFARIGWPGQSPLGRRFRSDTTWFTVVGVVGDVRQWGPELPARPELYRLFAAEPRYDSEDWLMARPYVLLRTAGEPLERAAALRQAVRALDPDQPITDLATMQQRVEQASESRRFLTTLITALAGIALALVATGLYGLMATIVVQRTHELGVRMALGADARSVVSLVFRQSFGLALAGVVAGLVGVLATTPLLRNQLYDARATDPLLVSVGTLLVVLTTIVGATVPAWRASRVCPTQALRAG
ncbi:MAG: ABC transporter permease [Thermoanaerobaculaceae bacterium]|jgi:predicted permease|nr:ABC transporter permease [Thermoanaerobaculaceae bacterium]